MKNSIILFSLLLCNFGFAQSTDSLKQILKGNIHDTTRVKVYLQIAEATSEDQMEEIIKYTLLGKELDEKNLSNKLSEKLKIFYLHNLANQLNNLGWVNNQKHKLFLAYDYHRRAISILREIGHKDDLATGLFNLGTIYSNHHDADNALALYKESLEMLGNSNDGAFKWGVLYSIAYAYEEKKDYKQAIQYFEQALAIAKESHEEAGELMILNELVYSCNEIKDTTSSLKYCEAALTYRGRDEFKSQIANTLSLYARILELKKNFVQADKAYEQSKKLLKENGEEWQLATLLRNQAYLNYRKNNVKVALKYGLEALSYSKRFRNNSGIRDDAKLLVKIYTKLGNKDSVVMQQLFLQMEDSVNLMRAEQDSAFAKYKREYKAYDEKQATEKLKENKNDSDQQKEKAPMILYIISGVVLVLVCIFLIIKKRKKSN